MLLSTMLALVVQATPAPSTRTYYAGEARVISPFGQPEQHQRVLLIREVDQARSRIVETACLLTPGQPPVTSPVYMRVDGTNLSISDAESGSGGHLTGTGRLVGEPWAWRELHFDMTYNGPRGAVRIEDLNLMLPGRLLARKRISVAGGPIVQLWEGEVPEVAEAPFRAEWTRAGCAS
jgi:hypothetical protein